jgi:L-threonylcarbamoyladenylate synthase
LFACLREADASGAQGMVVSRAPEYGLGRAINDRLQRAAHFG